MNLNQKIQSFLNEHKNFKLESMVTLIPHKDSDGFFFARFIKE